MSHPIVRILGVALSVSACHHDAAPPPSKPPEPVYENPPPPVDPVAEVPVTPTPVDPAPVDAALPTWESIRSGHPEGATNPPSPLLVVSKDPPLCFKDWLPGMIKPDPEVMDLNGRVVATPASVGRAVPVQCPPGQPAALLDAAARRDAGMK